MPGGSPGFFLLEPESNRRATTRPNAHAKVDDCHFPVGGDGRAAAHAGVVDEPAENRRSAPTLPEDRGRFFLQHEAMG